MQNPFDVPLEADLLTDLAGAPPGFTENMFFQASNDRGIGFWIHVASSAADPGLWRSLVALYQPNGQVLMGRSFGRPRDRRGPDTGALKVTCTKEHERWSIEFDGALQRTTSSYIGGHLVGGGVVEPVRMSVELQATSPVYDLFAAVGAPQQEWGGTHHEQAFAVNGTITVRGEAVPFSGAGYRDHSSGARDFTNFRGSNLIFGTFEDGQVFGHADLLAPGEGVQITQSYLSRDGAISLAKNSAEFDLTNTLGNPTTGRLELVGDDDSLSTEWLILHSTVFSAVGANDWVVGTDLEDADPLILVECPIWLRRSDGCTGVGHLERTRRLGVLTDS